MQRQTTSHIEIEEIQADLTLKKIRNLHIRVCAPDGAVRISAPARMSLETIMGFARSRLDWIRAQQARFRAQVGPARLEFIDGEMHRVWGTSLPLRIGVATGRRAGNVELASDALIMNVRGFADQARRRDILEDWYRDQVKAALPGLIARWEPVMGVHVNDFVVQRMKTRWGTCIPKKRRIRINTELARHPAECLEYVVIHELAHLLEPSHGPKFVAIMDRFCPGWKAIRRQMNSRPLPLADWDC
jgi:predicted metal-dependent hydrolase